MKKAPHNFEILGGIAARDSKKNFLLIDQSDQRHLPVVVVGAVDAVDMRLGPGLILGAEITRFLTGLFFFILAASLLIKVLVFNYENY